MFKNPFFISGSIIFGTFLTNFLIHELFEDHPFFSDIRGHIYHIYIALIGLCLLFVYIISHVRKLQRKSKTRSY